MEKTAPTKSKSTSPEADSDKKQSPVQSIALIVALIAGILLIGLYFLLGLETRDEVSSDQPAEEIIEANCTVTECITKIATSDSIEQITAVIGVDPETDEASGTSKWKLSSKESISREKSGSGYILQATIDKSKIASDEVDFSSFNDLKKELESGKSFTYEELVKRLGGVEGTLAGKTDTSKRYMWVDKHDRTFGATFSDKNGQCTIISLR